MKGLVGRVGRVGRVGLPTVARSAKVGLVGALASLACGLWLRLGPLPAGLLDLGEAQSIVLLDRNGEVRELSGEALMARAICHEIDHLNGTLFVDYLRGLKRDRILKKIQKLAKAGMW